VVLYLEYVLEERLRRLFPCGARVVDVSPVAHPLAARLAAAGVRIEWAGDGNPPSATELFDGAFAIEGAGRRLENGRFLGLAEALRPGAPLLLHLAPREGAVIAEVRRALGPLVAWRDVFALGLLVPSEDRGDWVARHPQTFGLLAALERVVRRWPALRAWGRAAVLEGVRR
jgi:hypothetical protein